MTSSSCCRASICSVTGFSKARSDARCAGDRMHGRNRGRMTPVDELDSAIVALLQADARQTNRELARRLGVAPSTCLQRVRGLQARGVIRGFRAEVDLLALGR